MSEYQYYEFLAVDRNGISTRYSKPPELHAAVGQHRKGRRARGGQPSFVRIRDDGGCEAGCEAEEENYSTLLQRGDLTLELLRLAMTYSSSSSNGTATLNGYVSTTPCSMNVSTRY